MPKISTPVNEATAQVTGLYLNNYQEIVKPNQRFLVSNYFIHYWLRKLGPTLAWIIVSLQQACWRANDATCIISQTVIGDEVGLTDRTIRKVLKENPFRHWFIPDIQYQPGTFDYKKKVYQPLPNKYAVYLASPLTPEHLAGLCGYLRTVCPTGQPANVDQAIADLLARNSKDSLGLLEEYAQKETHTFDRPVPLTEVVAIATGLALETLPQATAAPLIHNLDKLHTHLTEIGSTICRQYFRLTWVPRLGPALAWLVMIMRSRCYYNPETEDLRDTYTWPKKELAEQLGQSTKNLSNLLSHPHAHLFGQILDQNKRKITLRVNMVHEPLASEEEAGCVAKDNQTLTLSENRKKVPVTTLENRKKVPVTTLENRKKVPVTDIESEKSSGHTPSNRKKVPPCKYYKESVLIIDKDHEINTIQNNDVVVDKSKNKIKSLLSNAGLSGMGLSKLCNKDRPLTLPQVQAALLYAEANNLGPGYIYRHLNHDDITIDDLFMKFAMLDDETLASFREAVNELKINGTFTTEIQTPIPEAQSDLFAKFAETFAGIEASRVISILRHSRHLKEQISLASLDSTFPDELVLDKVEPFTLSSDLGSDLTGKSAYITPFREKDHGFDIFWQQALEQLRLQMTQGTFDSWIKDTKLIARDGLCFTILVKNSFAKEWLEKRLFGAIHRTITNLVRSEADPALGISNGGGLPEMEIVFVVNDEQPSSQNYLPSASH